MTIETVTVPRFLKLVHPKFTLDVDLARFGTDVKRGQAFAKGLTNVCADKVGAATYVAGSAATIADAQKRLDALYLDPTAGSERAVDDVRDMLCTTLGAKKVAARNVLATMDAEQLAGLADPKTVKQVCSIVDPTRADALVKLATDATDATRAAIIAAGAAIVADAKAKAKAKAEAKAAKAAKA